MTIVLDASAAVHLVLNSPTAPAVRRVIDQDVSIVAPDLYGAEVANALWKYVRSGSLSAEDAESALANATRLISQFVPSEEVVREALHEAAWLNHPVYDLLYLVCARRESATIVSCDRRLVLLCRTVGVLTADLH